MFVTLSSICVSWDEFVVFQGRRKDVEKMMHDTLKCPHVRFSVSLAAWAFCSFSSREKNCLVVCLGVRCFESFHTFFTILQLTHIDNAK